MQELIDTLSAGFASVTSAIENQEAPVFDCPDISLVACNSLNNGGFPDEPPVDFPEEPILPSETPEPTTPTYEEYKCRATNKYLDASRNLINNFSEMVHQQSPYDWLVDLLTNEEFGSPIYSVLIAIYNFLTSNSYGSLKDEMLAAFDSVRDEMMCAIYAAETPADAVSSIRTIIDGIDFNFAVRYLLKLVIIDSTSVEPIWVEGQIDITGYEFATCDCDPEPIPAGVAWNVFGVLYESDKVTPLVNNGDNTWSLDYYRLYYLRTKFKTQTGPDPQEGYFSFGPSLFASENALINIISIEPDGVVNYYDNGSNDIEITDTSETVTAFHVSDGADPTPLSGVGYKPYIKFAPDTDAYVWVVFKMEPAP